jgi:hypothetical protein
MSKPLLLAALLLCTSLPALQAKATEKLPASVQAGQHRLILNGSGVRTKTLLELYTAGLYLLKPSNDATAVIDANEPMALRIKITSSFVSKSSLIESLEEGFKKSMGGDTREIRKEIDQFRELFKAEITKGDVIDMVYLPEHGVIVNKNGKLIGAVAGQKFKRALFSIWLSENPADSSLKQALLKPQTTR